MDLQVESSWLEEGFLGRVMIVFCLAAIALAINAVTARASITIGQLAPTTSVGFCSAGIDRLDPSVTSGNSYAFPAAGTVTSWSTNAGANTGQRLVMKIFRKVSEPDTYSVVAHDGPRDLTQNTLNTFSTSISVRAGDLLGMNSFTAATSMTYCDFPVVGDPYLFRSGDLTDGASASFADSQPDDRLNISAVFTPSNGFIVGAVRRNKKVGTATLTVSAPGPGELVVAGAGLTTAAPGGVSSTAVAGAGDVQVMIAATGAKRKKLTKKGKVSVAPILTYTPTGGDAASQTTSVKLKLRPRKKRR
jgi:hypothetical protein